ncbi:M50 family metallopeptidase [Sutcliffiella cohnii]|uniref:Stage IV sporulation protein FB n=1 Tax=Sutcliffiella cohnii TaxID=33932 RepID=A0A223KTA6_9BACI|nr:MULTISPECIES: M50 family metallopeptidase [Sutcliffiella]AST92732.1 stage IV sporulation protein FB [Sutcliffiella cohnii]WBL13982.1 M50 family metallopeptidase [Sutcliffiella sp. NC1]
MNRYVNVLRKIHIHPVFWAIIGLSILTAKFWELLLLFSIVLVHELGHGFAAAHFKWKIKQILLLPFGGVAEMEEHGNRPVKEEVIVILAGPFQHVWLAILAYFLYIGEVITLQTFEMFFSFNVMILVVNLLPIWPLDGGKLLFILLSKYYAFSIAHEKALRFSFFFLIAFSILYLIVAPLHLNVWIIVAFLLFSLIQEWRQRHYVFIRFLLERYYGRKNEFTSLKPIVVDEKDKLLQVLYQFKRDCKHSIVVMKGNAKQEPLDENELLHAYFAEKLTSINIGDILYSY